MNIFSSSLGLPLLPYFAELLIGCFSTAIQRVDEIKYDKRLKVGNRKRTGERGRTELEGEALQDRLLVVDN